MKKIIMICMLFLIIGSPCQAADLTGMIKLQQFTSTADSSSAKIVINADQAIGDYHSFYLSNPARLVIDVDNSWVDLKKTKSFTITNQYVKNVRIGQYTKKTVRIVIDLTGPIQGDQYKIYKADKKLVIELGKIQNNSQIKEEGFPIPRPITFFKTPGLKGKKIVLDPGHGGSDSGAVGPTGLMEKEVTLNIALELKNLLEKEEAQVTLTRTSDVDVFGPNASAVDELQARVDAGDNADLFICIHIDSFSKPEASGTTTYFYPKTTGDERLAEKIQTSLTNHIGLNDRGIQKARFYVLKYSSMPASLVEVAFISNPAEEKLLRQSNFIKRVAYGIYLGLDDYFK